MAALNEREISLIKDEDLLKRMWQDTEDFGKKKEIRAHMYKLREAKLKDLYCNTDNMRDIQISKNAKTSFVHSTHADSLADHSFASLKSKEIRDSESPSREISYRLTSGTNNQGWNVSKTDEYSQDGKSHRIAQSAHTSGTEILPKGQLNYEASNKQEAVSFQDGDDKNFIKSQQTSAETYIKQEAHGGDAHSNFKTSSSKTSSSSSSRKVIEQKSSYDDEDHYVQSSTTPQINSNNQEIVDKTVKVYTTDAPRELKTHPGYVEGRTKVTKETKTLADGTVVTTTKYETTGANQYKTSSSDQYESSTRSSVRENKATVTSFDSRDEKMTSEKDSDNNRVTNQQPKSSRYYVEKTHNMPNNKTENYYENIDSSERNVDYTTTTTKQSQIRKNSDQKRTTDHKIIVDKSDYSTSTTDKKDTINKKDYSTGQTTRTTTTTTENRGSTNISNVDAIPVGTPIEIEINIGRTINDSVITNEKETTSKNVTDDRQSTKNKFDYDVSQRREPIKPVETEFKTKPTQGQYDTTYRTDFTNKKISIEVSPTHDAFARSLRAVSPDHLSSRTSSRNLKNSSSSLRSSSSPEKTFMDRRHPSRMSPDRHSSTLERNVSPSKKTPDRFSSSETITYKSIPNSQRNSPVKSTDIGRTNYTRKSPDKNTRSHRDITTDLDDVISVTSHTTVTKFRPSTLEYSTKNTKRVTERSPTSPLKVEKTNTYEEKSSKVEKEVTTKKDRPQDRPLKRSDTYEERCRQILGITNESNERRRGSLDRLKRRGSSTSTHTEIITQKVTKKSPSPARDFLQRPTKPSNVQSSFPREMSEKTLHEKNVTSSKKNSIQEFPAQIRRTPERKPSFDKDNKQKTIVTEKKHFIGQGNIQEYPSQIRKSPERKSTEKPTYDDKKNQEMNHPTEKKIIQEFPAQIRKTPDKKNIVSNDNIEINETLITNEKQTLERERIQEFPSQIRRSPEKTNKSLILEPERIEGPNSSKTKIEEFPSQVRKPSTKLSKQNVELEIEVSRVKSEKQDKKTSKRKNSSKIEKDSGSSTSDSDDECSKKNQKQPTRGNKPDNSNNRQNIEKRIEIDEIKNQAEYNNEKIQRESERNDEREEVTVNEEVIIEENIYDESKKSRETGESIFYEENVNQTFEDTEEENDEVNSKREETPRKKLNVVDDTSRKYSTIETTTKTNKSVISTDHHCHCQHDDDNHRTTRNSSLKNKTQTKNISKNTSKETFDKTTKITPQKPNIKHDENQSNKTKKSNYDQIVETAKHNIEINGHKTVEDEEFDEDVNIRQYIEEIEEPSLKNKTNTSGKDKIVDAPKSIPSLVKKAEKPSKPTKKDFTDDVEDLQEKKNVMETYEGRIPVEETLIPRKSMSLLYSDDEDEKKTTQLLIESEITDHRMIKKDEKPKERKPQKNTSSRFITNEKTNISTRGKTTSTVTNFQPNQKRINDKKPLLENDQNKIKSNEITNKKSTIHQVVKQENKKQNTLSDIENFDDIKRDQTKSHIRTHRVDDSLTKKKTATVKLEIVPKSQLRNQTRKPNAIETSKPKPNIRNQATSEKTTNKQLETLNSPSKIKQVSTSQIKITSKSIKDGKKTTKKNVDYSQIKKSTYSPRETVVDSSESDDESIPDSLNEETTTRKDFETTVEKQRIPSRTMSKPDFVDKSNTPKPKLEKRCLSTKSIIMNHETTKGITIDLQRSISSREATPDKVCPLPVTSDDDNTSPRYPDKVVEPEEPKNKKTPRNLFETTIRENEDGHQTKRTVDITEDTNRKVTEVDRVDENDESLLTVNKKINRFLNTVEKLTDKTVVDISQPAPKVERPKFEIDDSLKEDDCLLSVSDKVNKFITEAEQLTSQKNTQNKTSVDIDIKSDVSKRVNQFTISSKEKPEYTSPKNKEPNKVKIDEDELPKPDLISSPQQKKIDLTLQQDVFITTECEQIEKEEDIFRTPQRSPSKKDASERSPERKPKPSPSMNEPAKSLEREPKKPTEYSYKPKTTKSPERKPEDITTTPSMKEPAKSPERDSNKPSEYPHKPNTTRSPERVSPTRQTNIEITSIDKKITETNSSKTKTPSRSDSFKEFTPKNHRRPSQEEKVILSSVGRIRSSESIKKAKALFENGETIKREKKRQEDILTRPSVFEERLKTIKDTSAKKIIDRSRVTPRKLDFPSETSEKPPKPQSPITIKKYSPDCPDSSTTTYRTPRTKSSPEKEIPGYMRPLDRSLRDQSPQKEEPIERPETPDEDETTKNLSVHEKDLPGYMKPLDRSLRAQNPQKDAIVSKEPVGTPTKFGVTLKRTDSNRGMVGTSTTNKKHPILLKKTVTEEEIEQIYQLEVLEELLLKLTGYEIRRTVRNQIRLVKKLISENRLEITIQNIRNKTDNESSRKTQNTEKTTREYTRTSPTRKTVEDEFTSIDSSTITKQYSSTYTRKQSSSSITRLGSSSPERQSPSRTTEDMIDTRTYTRNYKSKSPERKPSENKLGEKTIITKRTHNSTYEKSKADTKSSFNITNKLQSNKTKTLKSPSTTNQPEWISNRNLKKVTPIDEVSKKTTVNSSRSVTSVVKNQKRTSSPPKEIKTTDLITSSYGVGPTDENGAPLFGLKALRAQNKAGIDSTTKVQGTVITSQYYSETGKEPVGKISVTKYSTDPKDLGGDEDLEQEGILSVTTTQKFGYDDAPSLKQLTNIEKVQNEKRTSKSSTLTRRNSVKALTQKFVEAETSKNERQSSYPKAGLILRSSSFKNDTTRKTDDSDIERFSAEENVEESISTSTKVVSNGTFLRNKSKVTGLQDVMTRMRTEEIENDDTEEDIEAKSLLNKYLGTQIILSEIEGHVSKTATARAVSSATASKSTTKVTTVTMENGKEVKKVTVFEHPISADVLENVWDEQTLRYLLEQSTDYEERRRIRARLRVVMAEQEACTELVKQASQEQSGRTIDETVDESKKVSSEGSVTTKVSTRVVTQQQQQISKKPLSPFAKFRQLDKQNSINTPPSTPRTPGGSPLFKFTDAALSQSASTIKDRLLHWCRMKTKEYENIQLDNFSTSWADGLAFCALIHHFLPESFDYHSLNPKERRHNFELAFKVADEKADIAPLLDVDDMVATRRPDWKCVFTYVQSIYRRFKDED